MGFSRYARLANRGQEIQETGTETLEQGSAGIRSLQEQGSCDSLHGECNNMRAAFGLG